MMPAFIIMRWPVSDVRLEFNASAAIGRRELPFANAQAALDTQVLKDSNLFAPKADNFLRSSGRIERPGLITYNTPYARRQYYLNEEVRGEVHYTTPGTMAKWFEHAKALFKKQWEQIAQKALR
jgi:hypothetical protein